MERNGSIESGRHISLTKFGFKRPLTKRVIKKLQVVNDEKNRTRSEQLGGNDRPRPSRRSRRPSEEYSGHKERNNIFEDGDRRPTQDNIHDSSGQDKSRQEHFGTTDETTIKNIRRKSIPRRNNKDNRVLSGTGLTIGMCVVCSRYIIVPIVGRVFICNSVECISKSNPEFYKEIVKETFKGENNVY